jgi:hypothetical protein
MLSLLRKKPQLQSIVSIVSKIVNSNTLHLNKTNRLWSLSIAQFSGTTNDGLDAKWVRPVTEMKSESIHNKSPDTVIPSHSQLKLMIERGELFPDISLTQQDVDRIIISELPRLSKYDLVQFLFRSVKFSKKRNRGIEIVRRHLELIKTCLSQFPTSSWTAKDVGFIVNSLQSVRTYDAGTIYIT